MTRLIRTNYGWIALWVGASLLVSHLSFAEDPAVAQAREYFRAGAQAYSVGEYGAAIQAFEQAYERAPRPAVLFSIAQAERRQFVLGHERTHLRRAVEMYRRYVAEETQSARKADAVQALSELEPLLAVTASEDPSPQGPEGSRSLWSSALTSATPRTRIMISTAAQGATISLDGHTAVSSPFVQEVEPGEHLLRVQAPGYQSTERRVTAVAGELVAVDLPLLEKPALLEVLAPPEAQLSIDGRMQGRCPFPKPIELPSGVHLITVSKNGFIGISSEETLVRGKTTVFQAPMRRSRQRTTAMFMLGASASALTTGGIFAYFSYKQEQAAKGFLDSRGIRQLSQDDLAQYNSTRIDRDRIRGAAWASVGIGLGLGLTSALMWLYDSGSIEMVKHQQDTPQKDHGRLPRLVAEPWIGPNSTGLGLHGAF